MKNIVSFDTALRLKKLGFNLPAEMCYVRKLSYDDFFSNKDNSWTAKEELLPNLFQSLLVDDYANCVANKVRFNTILIEDLTGKELIRMAYDYYTDFVNEDYVLEDVNEFNWNGVDLLEVYLGSRLRETGIENYKEKAKSILKLIDPLIINDYDKFNSLGENLYTSYKANLIHDNKERLKQLKRFQYIIELEDILNHNIEKDNLFQFTIDTPELISAPDYISIVDWVEKEKGIHFNIIWDDKTYSWEGSIVEKPEIKFTGKTYSGMLQNLINDTIYYLVAYDK